MEVVVGGVDATHEGAAIQQRILVGLDLAARVASVQAHRQVVEVDDSS